MTSLPEQCRLLIVDDERGIRLSLRGILEDEGYTVFEASSAEEGLAFLEGDSVDLLFLDIWLPGMDGLEMLELVHAKYPELAVIMISGHGTIETAVSAIKKGAHDFIEKPLSLEKVLLAVERTMEFQALKRENVELKNRLASQVDIEILGQSLPIRQLKEQISRVAPLDTSVLITGENGTGKELVAKALHQHSSRRDKALIALNCAAIPEELIESELFGHEKGAFTGAEAAKEGRFEMAHGGTLFLDEIGDMSLKTQAKILRILQERVFERVGSNRSIHVDVRVVAATNKDLLQAIKQGTFREDLYYRLCVFPLEVPPLRERGDDIMELAMSFVHRLSSDLKLAPITLAAPVRKVFLQYAWPGNVRELRNLVERLLILYSGKQLDITDLPLEFQGVLADQQNITLESLNGGLRESDDSVQLAAYPLDFKAARNLFESQLLAARLKECDGNISKLAEKIGLERSYLYRKLRLYNLQTE